MRLPPSSRGGKERHCFELFGLDFMLDEVGSPVLIEVNTSPALFRHGRCLTEMLPRMMEECVQKCVDVVFPPPSDAPPVEPRLDRWMRLDVRPVKLASTDGSSAVKGAGAARKALNAASPFRPGQAGGAAVKPKPTTAQRLAKKPPGGAFK